MNRTIEIAEDQNQFIEERLSKGRFASANELFNAALRLLQEREDKREELLQGLRRDIDIAEEHIRQGLGIPIEEAFQILDQRKLQRTQ